MLGLGANLAKKDWSYKVMVVDAGCRMQAVWLWNSRFLIRAKSHVLEIRQ